MDNLKNYLHYAIHLLLTVAIILLILRGFGSNTTQRIAPERPQIPGDTVYMDTIIYKELKVPVPKLVYVTKYDTVWGDNDTIIQTQWAYIDTSEYLARYYSDSIEEEFGKIRWSAATTGELLALDATFDGKYPTIVQYKDREFVKYRGQLLLTSGIGYNGEMISGDIGLEYVTRKGKKYGYEYDFINGFHSIKTGLRLF